nr:HAMP domain-containing histidine kinase [Pyrinomonadaceae bacterium]
YEDEILQAKQAAEEASQAKAKFLSMMSHDLRTPLTAIIGFTEILTLGIGGPVTEAQLDYLRRIESSSQYLLNLITDILNFARLEAGRVDARLETVSVDAALGRAESLVALRVSEAGLEYAREECAREVAVLADPDRLQQILLNLLTNSIKYTDRGGRVSVGCERVGSQTHIHIRDTGRGISVDQIERVFDPFVQVERPGSESSHQGVGLGLAISRELARAMGGDLTVESTIGRGSVFTIALPTSEAIRDERYAQ